MRCVGVCTTLSREEMQLQAPDAIRPDISHIEVGELQGLAYTVAL